MSRLSNLFSILEIFIDLRNLSHLRRNHTDDPARSKN